MHTQEEISPIFVYTIIILAVLILKFIRTFIKFCKKDIKFEPPRQRPATQPTPNKTRPQYTNVTIGYQRAKFLTQNEYRAYFTLKEIAEEKGLVVCPKVRLLDIVEPQYGIPRRRTMLSKVMSKHVDFVICKPDMQIFAIVELDDRTHLRPDRIQRDQFVDSVLHSVGYPVIHTYAITSDIFDSIQ